MKKKVEISESPCVKCEQYAECTSMCSVWKDWFREVWPIVTGQRRHDLVCSRCGNHIPRDMVADGFAICPICEEEVEDNVHS